jgi:hypothetical protein
MKSGFPFPRLAAVLFPLVSSFAENPAPPDPGSLSHGIVFSEEGKYGGWPANGGMWIWGDEVLVCFTKADHKEQSGHTFNKATARNAFGRSLDGGQTWTLEDAKAQGITAFAHDHQVTDGVPPRPLDEAMDFAHPDFALLFQNESFHHGPSHFYFTQDRGRSWRGPFAFPDLDTHGVGARTDYIIEGPRDALVFLNAGKSDRKEGRVGAFRTRDGGLKWERVGWIGPEPAGFAIMPSSVRLGSGEILTTIRFREDKRTWITAHVSADDGVSWRELDPPVTDSVNSPPALVRLPNGRLVLAYAFRRGGDGGSKICARISRDDGRTWSGEIVLRGDDGANGDIGYPRMVLRGDGKLLLTYYWNHALNKDKPPYRHIAWTIWDVGE